MHDLRRLRAGNGIIRSEGVVFFVSFYKIMVERLFDELFRPCFIRDIREGDLYGVCGEFQTRRQEEHLQGLGARDGLVGSERAVAIAADDVHGRRRVHDFANEGAVLALARTRHARHIGEILCNY